MDDLQVLEEGEVDEVRVDGLDLQMSRDLPDRLKHLQVLVSQCRQVPVFVAGI